MSKSTNISSQLPTLAEIGNSLLFSSNKTIFCGKDVTHNLQNHHNSLLTSFSLISLEGEGNQCLDKEDQGKILQLQSKVLVASESEEFHVKNKKINKTKIII